MIRAASAERQSFRDGIFQIALVAPVGVLLLFSACTYSFSGSSVPKHLKTIAIPLFEDQSGFGEPTLKESLTQNLITLFTNDNSLEVAERNTADSILEGSVVSVEDAPSVIAPPVPGSTSEQVSKRRITVTVHVVFQDLKLRKKVWEKNFSNWGEYSLGTETRAVAITQAVGKVTEDILIETVSGW
ncbi:MAG TPA: LptE family protein [Bacteroidota bacterium]|nr:LptE family protein [Bacteroidota bacterium]